MTSSELIQNCYVPYSGQPSAAVVQSAEGDWFPGIRIENISFPLTISSIQNALFCCLSEGHTPQTLYCEHPSEINSELHFFIDENRIKTDKLSLVEDISFHPVVQNIAENEVETTLKKLQNQAQVPHSNFPVSVLIETAEGFIAGVNIEPDNWSGGLCAERVALAKALSYKRTDFRALHIYAPKGEYNSPCGACRQVIIEHLSHHPVYLHHADGTVATHFSSDLLPYSFQSSILKKDAN